MHNFKELNVWKKAIDLTTEIYKITRLFPDEEKYGLKSQINRSAVSIPSNIAEGAGRKSEREFDHFLSIASGSSCELETQLIVAKKLEYLKEDEFGITIKNLNEIQSMIHGLRASINKIKSN